MIVICTVALAGCGSTGGTTNTAKLTPQQSDNAQRDVGYVRAVNQVMAPFNKPPPNLTDYVAAGRELDTAIRGLGSLSAPPPFAFSQAHLVAALRAQSALVPRIARAARTHDLVAENNIEAQNLRAEADVRISTQEIVQAYNRCRSANFRAC